MTFIRKHKTILIYGAGKIGNGLSKLFNERSINNYKFVISDCSAGDQSIINNKNSEDSVVIISAKYGQDKMYNYAKELGFIDIMRLDF